MAPTPRLFAALLTPAQDSTLLRHGVVTWLLCTIWVVTGLVWHDPWKPDEAYTFGLVLHMLQTDDWVVPTLAGEPFMELPPAFLITATAFASVFAPLFELHDGARLAAGFFMSVTLVFVALSARELYGREHGWVAPLALIGCVGLLVRAHQMIADTALLAGFAIGLYGLCLSARRPLLAGLALGSGAGLAFMSKGLVVPVVLMLSALLLPAAFSTWRRPRHLAVLITAAVASLPWLLIWPLALHERSPELFEEWFWVHSFGRFVGPDELAGESTPGEYFVLLLWYAWPALPLAAWVLWQRGREAFVTPSLQLPVLVFLVTFVVLSMTADARELYAMPMLLPLALLAAASIDALKRSAANFLDWFGIMTFGLFALMLWIGYGALHSGWPGALAIRLSDLNPGFEAVFNPLAFGLAVLATLFWIGLVSRVGRSNRRAIINWAAGLTLTWALANLFFLSYIDHVKSYRGMIAEMSARMPERHDCIGSQSLGESQRAMLHYFAGLQTRRIERPGSGAQSCDLFLWQGSPWDREPLAEPWVKLWEGSRPGDRRELFRLYRRDPSPELRPGSTG